MSYLNSLEDNLTRVKKAKINISEFGDIGGGPLLDSAREIQAKLEDLEGELIAEINKETDK